MGGSRYSSDDYDARASSRASTGKKVFAYDDDIRTGKTAAQVHTTLDPHGVKMRESRDSDAHPVTIPIGITLDTTGSMATVPMIIQEALNKLMAGFLAEKVSNKAYLGGDGYPAILISAVDDWHNGERAGCFQVGQFESGLEIEDNLTNLWITGNGGGGQPRESYDLAMYFAAKHTAHDHWEKRHKKGYWFIIGDETAYDPIDKAMINGVIGDSLQEDQSLMGIIKEVQKRYHLFFILPNMTYHFSDKVIEDFWKPKLAQAHFVRLDDPKKICECIVSCVAMHEGVSLDELMADNVAVGLDKALVQLSKVTGAVVHGNLDELPEVTGTASAVERI